jgi:hypothetical protein
MQCHTTLVLGECHASPVVVASIARTHSHLSFIHACAVGPDRHAAVIGCWGACMSRTVSAVVSRLRTHVAMCVSLLHVLTHGAAASCACRRAPAGQHMHGPADGAYVCTWRDARAREQASVRMCRRACGAVCAWHTRCLTGQGALVILSCLDAAGFLFCNKRGGRGACSKDTFNACFNTTRRGAASTGNHSTQH